MYKEKNKKSWRASRNRNPVTLRNSFGLTLTLVAMCVLLVFMIPPEDSDLDLEHQSVDPIEGLTERERRFGEAYFEVALTHNDSSSSLLLAYRRAFPLAENSDRSAQMLARGLISAPRVQMLVTRLRQNMSIRRSLPAERVIQELERIAFSNILDYFKVSDDGVRFDPLRLTPATAAAVQEITMTEEITEGSRDRPPSTRRQIKIRLCDKLSALDKLARFHNLLRDKRFSLEELDRLIREMERKVEDRQSASLTQIGGEQNDSQPLVFGSDAPAAGEDGQE